MKSGRQRLCLFEWPASGIVASGAGRHGWAPPNSDSLNDGEGGDGCVCACMCARTRVLARVRACVRASERASVRACVLA